VRARPVGIGAACASCGDRRLVHLRHFEMRGLWLVLCHNCCARAERVNPPPRSVDALLSTLRRERRAPAERRAAKAAWPYPFGDRRGIDRRVADLSLDATEHVADHVIEIEAEYASPAELRDPEGEPITGVHSKVDL
jgi:hypothetical protein